MTFTAEKGVAAVFYLIMQKHYCLVDNLTLLPLEHKLHTVVSDQRT